MRLLLLIILTALFTSGLSAQNGNINLLAQSADGKTVKLVWLCKSWNSDITGFDIKRKDGSLPWVKLNTEPILPEVSLKKKLSIVESDKAEEGRIKMKLYKLLTSHKLRETDNNLYLQNLNSNDKAVQDITSDMVHDYDMALISGFAYIDHTVQKKTGYQYGLFIQGTDKLLAKATWNYGEIPDLNAVQEITSRGTTTKNGIYLMWDANVSKMKEADVAGFNVYREGLRLNATPVQPSGSGDMAEYAWNDKSANTTLPIQYSISAESIFGIEGIIKPYTYDPADHPAEYKKAEVTEITSLGYYFKEGISVKWTFPKEFEKFIKGFVIEKDNMPVGYKQVTTVMDPAARACIDKTPSPVSGYVRFRVSVLYNDRTVEPGREKIYNYFPIREPPPPQNVKSEVIHGDKKITVKLRWDPAINGDSVTDYYKVYASDPISGLLEPVTEGKPVRAINYSYEIKQGSSAIYKFGVSSISRSKVESAIRDTVKLLLPSLDLPAPAITKSYEDSGKAVLQWQYPDISDVKGFRLYQNKVVVVGEQELNKYTRGYKTPKLLGGAVYEYTIRAIAENGILSDYSLPVPVNIPEESGK